jgi:hypothetical protein
MKTRMICFFILIFSMTEIAAQSPDFFFGPRIGMGSARFTGIPGMSDGFAGQIQIVADKHFTSYFSLQFSPMVAMYTAQRKMETHDGVMANGKSIVYDYHDKYQVYTVEFPLLVKLHRNAGKFSMNVFAGPSFGCPMGGSHSKIYEDEISNAKYGFVGHNLDELKDNFYSGIAGAGIEYPLGKSIIGLDFQITHPFTRFGNIEDFNFSAQSATIGFTWLHY